FIYPNIIYSKIIDDTLVLALSFDEGAGENAIDSSQYKLNGKVFGPQWMSGRFGKALEFDGIDDFVEVPDNPKLLLLDGGTFMAWVFIKTEKGHASWPRILIKSNTNGGTHGYDFLFDRAAGYSIRFCIGGACNSHFPVETNKWHHVAVTFNGKVIRVYHDGKKVGEQAQPGPAIDTTGFALRIGNSGSSDRPYHGLLDEIRIWSRALDENEIKWQMERGIREILPVEPKTSLAIKWAMLKIEED
ncbi:MAG: LamG domain-containing protein, partial [bacterium]